MPRELLQMDQLEKFYSSIANSRVKIKITSQSDDYMSFEVKGSYGSAVLSFAIGYYDSNNGLSAVKNYRDMISLGSYGWVKREDGSYRKQSTNLCSFKLGSEGYKLLTNLFRNLRKLDLFAYYDDKEFCDKTFSSFIKEIRKLNSQITIEGISAITSTTTELFNSSQLEEPTTEGVEYETQATGKVGTTDSATTELFNSSQLEESTNEEVDYEAQEGSEYFAVESGYLEEQEFDFTSNETTEEINYIMEEIKRSNASHGITTENIGYKNMTNVLGNTPKGVLARPIFNNTDVEGPKLPEIPGPSGAGVLAAEVAGGVLGVLGFLGVAVVYWLWSRKNREGGCDVEKARGVEESPEGSSLLPVSSEAYTTNGVEEPNSLLDVNEVIGSEVGYHSFKRNVSYNNIL